MNEVMQEEAIKIGAKEALSRALIAVEEIRPDLTWLRTYPEESDSCVACIEYHVEDASHWLQEVFDLLEIPLPEGLLEKNAEDIADELE